LVKGKSFFTLFIVVLRLLFVFLFSLEKFWKILGLAVLKNESFLLLERDLVGRLEVKLSIERDFFFFNGLD
jgi:hypothetical protein